MDPRTEASTYFHKELGVVESPHRLVPLRLGLALAMTLAALSTLEAKAQGTITHGALEFELHSDLSGSGGNANLLWQGQDQLFHYWWWYRVDGDTAESRFPAPDFQDYSGGDFLRLDWSNVDGRGFDAELTVYLVDCAIEPGCEDGIHFLDSSMDVTNSGGSPLNLSVFVHMDPDVGGDSVGDSVLLASPPLASLFLFDGSTNLGVGIFDSDAHQVTPFQLLRNELDDADIDNLDNSGVPSGPDDLTLAQQFDLHLDPGAEEQAYVQILINSAIFIDGFETGDTSRWTGSGLVGGTE